MAGYSSKTLVQKLGIKPGSRLGLVDAPARFDATLGELPEGVIKASTLRGSHDVVVIFAKSRKVLDGRFDEVAKSVAKAGGLWVAWPKKISGVVSDLDENVVRDIGLARGWVDIKVCAIDDIWSGLKFVTRLSSRV